MLCLIRMKRNYSISQGNTDHLNFGSHRDLIMLILIFDRDKEEEIFGNNGDFLEEMLSKQSRDNHQTKDSSWVLVGISGRRIQHCGRARNLFFAHKEFPHT